MAPNYKCDREPTAANQRADIPTREGSVASEVHDLSVELKSLGEQVAMLRNRLAEVLTMRPAKGDACNKAPVPTQCKLAASIGEMRSYARTIGSDLAELLDGIDL